MTIITEMKHKKAKKSQSPNPKNIIYQDLTPQEGKKGKDLGNPGHVPSVFFALTWVNEKLLFPAMM
jgi:hypothetical protein